MIIIPIQLHIFISFLALARPCGRRPRARGCPSLINRQGKERQGERHNIINMISTPLERQIAIMATRPLPALPLSSSPSLAGDPPQRTQAEEPQAHAAIRITFASPITQSSPASSSPHRPALLLIIQLIIFLLFYFSLFAFIYWLYYELSGSPSSVRPANRPPRLSLFTCLPPSSRHFLLSSLFFSLLLFLFLFVCSLGGRCWRAVREIEHKIKPQAVIQRIPTDTEASGPAGACWYRNCYLRLFLYCLFHSLWFACGACVLGLALAGAQRFGPAAGENAYADTYDRVCASAAAPATLSASVAAQSAAMESCEMMNFVIALVAIPCMAISVAGWAGKQIADGVRMILYCRRQQILGLYPRIASRAAADGPTASEAASLASAPRPPEGDKELRVRRLVIRLAKIYVPCRSPVCVACVAMRAERRARGLEWLMEHEEQEGGEEAMEEREEEKVRDNQEEHKHTDTPSPSPSSGPAPSAPPSPSSSSSSGGVAFVGSHCSICLDVYRGHDYFTNLPACGHRYHSACIARWIMAGHANCPLDRIKIQGHTHDDQIQQQDKPE